MIIYKFESDCYNCKQKTVYYTYLLYHEYDIDVEFPLDMNMVSRIYAEMSSHKDSPYFDNESNALNFPIKILGDDDYFDRLILRSGKIPNLKIVNTKLSHKSYVANLCSHCHRLLGNYHLREKITDQFLRPNIPMKVHCIIK